MSNKPKLLPILKDEQAAASDPAELIWLSASAGTGKTQVLTARVLRMLLSGVKPETILCLTFTKAGAAEMADRIHARLASWVRMEAKTLSKELFALGEPNDDEAIIAARRLFAKVLDAPGGGLRIQTIHAFCQTLLAGFPSEAGLTPGFRPLDGRGEAMLARSTLADLLTNADSGGDHGLIRDVQTLSRRLGENKAEAYLMRCAHDGEAMAGLGAREGIEARLRLALGVPLGDVEEAIAKACSDDVFDMQSFRFVQSANAGWNSARGRDRAAIMTSWYQLTPGDRAVQLTDLHQVWATQSGDPRSLAKGQAPQDPDYAGHATRLYERCRDLLGMRAAAELAALLAAGLRAGQSYALAYEAAKRGQGAVDFDDLIRLAVRLLETPGMGDWVRYKLDQATDHILVDEAQDTNTRQWQIVAALAGEFFAGQGARSSHHRTIFTVGDFKQAIFGFQGTDPRAFEAARMAFQAQAEAVGRDFLRLSLDRSFRSAPPILEVVDKIIADLGADAMGLSDPAEAHVSARNAVPGTVTLWHPLSAKTDDDNDEDEGEEGWIDDATRRFAGRLARQIKAWIDDRLWMAGKGRPIRPEDIMILVRKRGALAALIVARLHAEGVPVAGVDRLRLNAPLPVRDLLAAIRFALQPEDDLNLASLLVSPLFGWSQEKLYEIGFCRKSNFYNALRDKGEAVTELSALLAQADFTTPYRFLETILSGPMEGRRKLVARLGGEALDPIEELLNAALTFETDATPSLQRFLDWFDRGEVEIIRDPSAPSDAVRVMTVHGAKGLQAPMVILADATTDPRRSQASTIHWDGIEDAPAVPIFRPRKQEQAGSVAAAIENAERREAEEHWRLLYVALTRAEERLVIGGALGPQARGQTPETSWHAAVERAMMALGVECVEDPDWLAAHHYTGGSGEARRSTRVPQAAIIVPPEPDWLRRPAPKEARPSKPLAPSAIGLDLVADPPPNAVFRDAALRGRLIHALFERLPSIAPQQRRAVGLGWLKASAGVEDVTLAEEILGSVCAILADPGYADLFGPDSLAEAPIAAVVGEEVISGTVDRLLVNADTVFVADFKTGRRVPRSIDQVPEHHLAQMAAYAAALATVFPGRTIEAALLYTSGPALIRLTADVLERYKPGYRA